MTKCCEHCGQEIPDATGINMGPFQGSIVIDGVTIRLKKSEVVLFRALLARFGRVVSVLKLFDTLYQLRPECDQPELNTVKTMVCKLRHALKNTDVEIVTDWGHGYMLRRRASESRAA